MPRLLNGVPKYRLHKQSGQAIVTLNGRDFLLGPHGTKASKSKYNKLVAEWLANDRQPFASSGLTIAELVARYWCFAERHYVKNGLPTDEVNCIKSALRPLLALYENELADNFGPVALKAVRQRMIETGWARQTINKNVDRIRRVFRWAVSEELLPVESYQRLATVPGLRKGRSEAREAAPVQPVSEATIEATLPHLTQTVADMVRVQRLAGMRPSEVCAMRPCDIDRSADVWVYRPESHKTEHHGAERVIFLGPQAQGILLRYLARDPEMYFFRPIDSEEKRRAEQHANRKTPLSCGNRPGSNRKKKPKSEPTDRYSADTYRRAIERACDRAFPPPAPLARARGETTNQWHKRLTGISRELLAAHYKKYRWTPNRLRHSAATEIRARFGSEAAQTVLGHANLSTTEIYAEKDYALAARVAREVG